MFPPADRAQRLLNAAAHVRLVPGTPRTFMLTVVKEDDPFAFAAVTVDKPA